MAGNEIRNGREEQAQHLVELPFSAEHSSNSGPSFAELLTFLLIGYPIQFSLWINADPEFLFTLVLKFDTLV